VIFLYWFVLDIGTSESPDDGDVKEGEVSELLLCSGEDSLVGVAGSRVVELTRGEKAEKGLCQFILQGCKTILKITQFLFHFYLIGAPRWHS